MINIVMLPRPTRAYFFPRRKSNCDIGQRTGLLQGLLSAHCMYNYSNVYNKNETKQDVAQC